MQHTQYILINIITYTNRLKQVCVNRAHMIWVHGPYIKSVLSQVHFGKRTLIRYDARAQT